MHGPTCFLAFFKPQLHKKLSNWGSHSELENSLGPPKSMENWKSFRIWKLATT